MCTSPLYGIRVLDYDTGAVTVKVIGSRKTALNFLPAEFQKNKGGLGDLLQLPCGQCMECRIAKAREWSIRLLHESFCHERNCFVTLTYDDDHLPADKDLHYDHVQKFLKSLRKFLDEKFGRKIRFYACGEYGSKSFRPHFHLIIFGEDFSFDRKLWSVRHGNKLFRSASLERFWTYGFSSVGSVSYDSVMYVARYVTKKIKGDLAEFYYDGLTPEFARMSRRPGIGHDFVERFADDVYNFDEVVIGKLKLRPPAYYDKLYADAHPVEFCKIKEKRLLKSQEVINDLANDVTGLESLNAFYFKKNFLAKNKVERKRGFESV